MPAIWSGAYVGVGAGGSWLHSQAADSFGNSSNHSGHGRLLNASVGYNWQSGNAIYGVEGEVSRGFTSHQYSESVFARAGIVQGNVLLFARLGAHIGQGRVTWTNLGTGSTVTDQRTVVGPAVGVGAEWAVSSALALRTDLTGSWSQNTSTAPNGTNQLEVKGATAVLSGSLIYKFH